MIATFRAGKTFAGTREFTGEATFVALINWRVSTVIGHSAVAVIPDIFQCSEVMLQVRVFAVTNEAAVRQWWVRCFEVQFVVWVNFLLDVQMEAVGVIALVGDAIHHAKFSGIKAAEAVTQVFTWCAVQAEGVTRFIFPGVCCLSHPFDDSHALFT